MKRNAVWIIIIILLLAGFYYYMDKECKRHEIEKKEAISLAVAHALDSVKSLRALQAPPERTHIVYIEKEVPQQMPNIVISEKENVFTDDRDGKQYKFIKVNDLMWMSENLNYESDGSFCYENLESNCDIMGRLYKWSSAQTSCPEGWHLPDDSEWANLFKSYGGVNIAGKALKKGGDSGFDALMAGYRDKANFYGKKDESAYFWSATEQNDNYASFRGMYLNTNNIGPYTYTKGDAFSVRCVKQIK